uniref:NADH-ubiquinone oxidoreductase chain 2 n=2 Tax=Chionoecetes TaxID=41209 RepID=A0A7G9IY37_9EUCA|nr:NADH dehydrogenase subunit 2 [Chionoecetes japonicus x Chionoecetes opilio]YP_009988808.1 NADH dehydrogenase subunit 2 [Chionoecetes japonicus]QNM40281.1 NADH dehydrogenase subunit 2 [Chionoecetes japonicus x Chionoecetes opilio]QNM40294.1 NADH dehydrogenase subunit 2 [Chionoecetes japonicus]
MAIPISSIFFLLLLIMSLILSISSSSWFGAWIGLELNLLSFIPLIATKMNSYSSEAALKYFLVQALASSLIIMSTSLALTYPYISSFIILMALLLKLGAAPFHFWFPQVMMGLMWTQIIILMIVQKIAPMLLISYLMETNLILKTLILSAIFSAVVGALGGLNNMSLRKIMAFSSINHMSWMFMALTISETMWLMYFIFYSTISISVVLLFNYLQIYNISSMLTLSPLTSITPLAIPMALLSMGGLPPFTGFIPKWILIQIMVDSNMVISLVFLLSSTLITLFFYLRIIIPFFLLSSPSMSFYNKMEYNNKSMYFYSFIFFNLIGLMFPLTFIIP